MDIREQIIVNGNIAVKLQPYTELRFERLQGVEKEIDVFAEKHPDISFQEMKREDKARFWMKKAKILWDPNPVTGEDGLPLHVPADQWDKKNNFFTIEFFLDKSFEYPLLKKSQDFFLTQEMYL